MTISARTCAALLAAAAVTTTAACGSEPAGRPNVAPTTSPPAASTTAPASSPPEAVTARLVLSATELRAGETMSALVAVDNASGHPIEISGCGVIYRIALVGQGGHPGVTWPDCLQHITIPTGKSTYPVTVSAAFDECSPTPNDAVRRCAPDGAMPSLLPGKYKATAVGVSDLLPVAAPVAITVTA